MGAPRATGLLGIGMAAGMALPVPSIPSREAACWAAENAALLGLTVPDSRYWSIGP